LEALVGVGDLLRADCGGKGRCGKCVVRLTQPSTAQVSPPAETERRALGEERLRAGCRLACQTILRGDVSMDVPEDSRLSPEVGEKGPTILPKEMATHFPSGSTSPQFGIAVDLGTTTIAVYLCDQQKGVVVATVSVKNPQAMFGDDVMSRISAVTGSNEDLKRLQLMVIRAIEWGIGALCRSSGTDPGEIGACTVVGNSTMIHIFVGESPETMGVYPYDPLFVDDRCCKGRAIGFSLVPHAEVYTLPLIAGFLGSDILAAALATGLYDAPVGTMLVDVGTNGEVMLAGRDGMLATSCATGPAFEGATIRHGMQAISGAIDSVRIHRENGDVICSTLQKDPGDPQKPSGICGTGVVSAVAELFRTGHVSSDGRLDRESHSAAMRYDEAGLPEFILVPAQGSQTQHAITLTQRDVRAIQLAKGALLTGMELLCSHAGFVQPVDLLVAGAFGAYINREDARTIGMFPPLAGESVRTVGNAAGAGAVLVLLDERLRDEARELARSTAVVDLASRPEFQDTFLSTLNFPE